MDFVYGQPLFEAVAQTFIGVLAEYTVSSLIDKYYKDNTFNGSFDFWKRGIHSNSVQPGDRIKYDGLVSPYIQLFPRDPYSNAIRWNKLHSFNGKISAEDFSQMEFYAGSDDAIRTGSLNGETLVGLYNRYGYIGEGILGVVSTRELLRVIPDFFHSSFWGCRAIIKGKLSYCPAQHGFVAQSMFQKAGILFPTDNYKELPYIQISSIKLFNKESDRIASLLGSPWAATDSKEEPYIMQYGYFNDYNEMNECNNNIFKSKSWDDVKVFYDALTSPVKDISFTSRFIG